MGPHSVLITGGYYRCGASHIARLDPADRHAAEAEMRADWLAHRPHLLDIWHGRAHDPNAASKWFAIRRQPGPCWGERHLDAR